MDGRPSGDDSGLGSGLSRRRLLRHAVVATGGAVALGVAASGPATAGPAASAVGDVSTAAGGYTPVALTPSEFATLAAVVDRLIPPDDLGPGAADAGVPVYIDRSLAGPYGESLPLYRQNLAALNAAALAQGGVFAALSTDGQDALIKRLEATHPTPTGSTGGVVAAGMVPIVGASADFFSLLLRHTSEGMFGDPMYGGNKDFVGWDLIGYPGVKLYWSPEEQAVDAVIQPAHISDAKYGAEPAR